MAAATTLAAPALFWLLVARCGLGLDGAAIAFVACNAATLAGLVAFTVARAKAMEGDAKQTWGGFSAGAWQGWGEYLQYGEGGARAGGGGAVLLVVSCCVCRPRRSEPQPTHRISPPPRAGVPAASHICLE